MKNLSASTAARLLVILGAVVLSVGVGLVYVPAGVITLGAGIVAAGLWIFPVPPSAPPTGRPR